MKSYFETIGRIGAFDLFGIPATVRRFGFQQPLKQTAAYFERVIDEMIEERRVRLDDTTTQDLLTLLLRAVDPSTGRPMDVTEVRSNVLTFLSAGHETTANTLTWSLFLLSQSPDWFARVREEADRELPGPQDGLLERLAVTKAVVEEALRLYPPIAALSRMSIDADDLGACSVTPRSLIVIAPYVLHRHEQVWDRPGVFDPQRFLGQSREKIGRFSYLPFGTGPRTCIGSAFALQEATLVLATLVRQFDFELPRGVKIWPVQRVTLRPANGLPMHVSPRRSH
jgi:cytochrome P450